jgi:hypothetical protein
MLFFSPSPPWPARRRLTETKFQSKSKKTIALFVELQMEETLTVLGSNRWSTAARDFHPEKHQNWPNETGVELQTKGIKPTTGIQPKTLNLLCATRFVLPYPRRTA